MYVFIVNPVSGNGKTMKIWSNIEQILKSKNIFYDVQFTEYKGHATEIVQQLDSNLVTAVIVVGGDGTVHEVVNGLKYVNIALGIIPAGSGNDYARSMKVPKNYQLALERIITGNKKKIDILTTNERSCMTVVGIGFDGKVAEVANNSKAKKLLNKYSLGKFVYAFIVLKVLLKYKPTTVTVTLDGTDYDYENVWLITVANLPFCGGGMQICPSAQSNDGIFDVCIVHNVPSKWTVLKVFPKVFTGQHIHSPYVTMLRGNTIKVSSDTPVVIHGDGEIIGNTPIEVTIEKENISIV